MRGRLDELLKAARDLPGHPGHPVGEPRAVIHALIDIDRATGTDPAPLRARLASLVGELAARLRPALDEALERAGRAWDQVDALILVDDDWRRRAEELAEDWQAVGGAEALEAMLVLQTVPAIVLLLERRLAAFVRMRGAGDLRPGGRPFLDVPGALAELAVRWSR
jgi:hypothetical protein